MFFNVRSEFLSFHIHLIQIDKEIFCVFVFFFFVVISCFLVSDERFILLKWVLRTSLLHSFALDVFLLLLRRQVVIKSVMFWLRVTRLSFSNYLVFLFFWCFWWWWCCCCCFFFFKTWIKDVT